MAFLNVWVLAARPKTLPAAVAPVVVGGAAAAADDVFAWDRLIVALVAALAIQVGVNYANDLADARAGADTEHRVGPTRAVAAGLIAPATMRLGIAAAFTVAGIAGIYLIAVAGWVVAAIGVASIAAALAYTGGPWPYGYHGLGEVFVFVFFGLVATAGTRYLFDNSVPAAAWVGGVAMGCFAAAILEANNIRDLDTDGAAGKRTLAVVIGAGRARKLFTATIAAAYGSVAVGVAFGWMPLWCLVAWVTAPLALAVIRTVASATEPRSLIGALVATARLQLATAALLAAGLLLG